MAQLLVDAIETIKKEMMVGYEGSLDKDDLEWLDAMLHEALEPVKKVLSQPQPVHVQKNATSSRGGGNGWHLFVHEQRQKLEKEEFTSLGGMTEMSRRWKALTKEEQEVYGVRAREAKNEVAKNAQTIITVATQAPRNPQNSVYNIFKKHFSEQRKLDPNRVKGLDAFRTELKEAWLPYKENPVLQSQWLEQHQQTVI